MKPDDKEKGEEEKAVSVEPTKKPYSEPRLSKFGPVQELTGEIKISV